MSMKREPAIHITKSKLIDIYRDMGYGFYESDSMVSELMMRAKPHSIGTRTITTTNDRIEKKVKKLTSTSRLDADLFAQLIYATRKGMRHRGISQVKPGSRDWDIIKEITALALNFSEEFDLPVRAGFLEFIKVGISKMQKFGLNKFLGMYEGICETYIAKQEILGDNNSVSTSEMYKHYNSIIAKNTGILEQIDKIPEKYVWFVRASKQARDLNVSTTIYIDAQFEALDFTKGIPHPTQLVGPKAIERVSRYNYKHSIKIHGNGITDRDKLKAIFKKR